MTGNVSPYVDGDTVTFTCVVTGGIPTPTVQWLQNNANLNGETMTTLSFVAAQSSAGDYTCTATNSVGSLTSSAETLVMHGKLFVFRNKESTHSITFFRISKEPPGAATITGNSSPYGAGETIALTCVVTGGNPAPPIQWLKNGASLSDETSTTLTFLGSAASAGDYSCEASNILGQVSSSAETIIINREPLIFT